MILSIILALSSDLAFKSLGCHETMFKEKIDNTEAMIIKSIPVDAGMNDPSTRRGSYECVRFSFLLDERGRPIDIKMEETSNSGPMELAAGMALRNYRFNTSSWKKGTRLMLLFNEITSRLIPPASEIVPENERDHSLH